MATFKPLKRDQLAKFLPDHESIRQFENLFSIAEDLAPTSIDDLAISSANADSKASQALEQLQRISDALELLASSPVNQVIDNTVDYIDFKTSPHIPMQGRVAWNDNDKTLDIGMEYDVTQQVGLETFARVQNNTGVTIPNGTVVGFTGVSIDGTLSVAPYLSNGATSSLYILGVMTHDLPDSGDMGYCTSWGYVRGLDTSSFSIGDVLYASPTSAGAFTNVKPTAPYNVIPVAAVLESDAVNGVIFVRPTIDQQLYYGEFSKTDSQTPSAINTAYPVTLTTTDISNGVTFSTSQVTVNQAGLYHVAASVQVTSTSSSQKALWLWFRKNGTTDYPARVASIDLNNGYLSISLSIIASLIASDYIELMYASDSTSISISTVAATAFAPVAPAVMLSVTQTQQ